MSGFDPDHGAPSELLAGLEADLERRLEADAAAIREQTLAARQRIEDRVTALHGRERGDTGEAESAVSETEFRENEGEGDYTFVYGDDKDGDRDDDKE